MSFRQEVHHITCYFRGGLSSAAGHQLVEAVVALVFHIVQAVVQFLGGHGTLDQRAELRPCSDDEKEREGEQAPEDDFEDFFHFPEDKYS